MTVFKIRFFTLFADRRDEGLRGPVRDALREGPTFTVGPSGGPDGWIFSTAASLEVDEVVHILQRFDWMHQPLLVYRADGENRWNQVTIIRPIGDPWADGERG